MYGALPRDFSMVDRKARMNIDFAWFTVATSCRTGDGF